MSDPTPASPDPDTVTLGLVAGPVESTIDGDHLAAYALATNDPNPAYLDEGVAPPVFTVSLGLNLLNESNRIGVPRGAVRGATGGVHGEHDLYLRRPLLAGEPVKVTGTTHCAYNTGTAGAMTSCHIVVADPDDNPIIEHYWSTFHIKGQVDEVGPRLPDHTFPEDAHARPIGTLTIPVTRDQSYRYAGASTDHGAFHVHDEAARRQGFPGKFIQGLCTFAMCSQGVVQLAAGGDPRPVTRLAARFASPVFPGNDLEVTVYEAGTADGVRRLAFEATSAGATVIKHGLAELTA